MIEHKQPGAQAITHSLTNPYTPRTPPPLSGLLGPVQGVGSTMSPLGQKSTHREAGSD